jgi:peptide subunit release factor 1 (eRF1)
MSDENSENTGMSKYQLKKLVNELDDIRGRNTELVSLYIPEGYDMSKISEFITSEASEAENIKSKHTRKNVQAALDRIGRRVKEEHTTPENGVALFAGNVSDTEGRPDIELWEVHPPQPIESRRYRCDKEFVLQPLKDMIVDDRVYGLVVMDKNEAAVGYLQGNSIKTVYKMESEVPGKTRAGGQCLDPDTLVQMSNGDLKKIEDIEIGDEVKAADFESMTLKDSVVQDKWSEKKQVYRIETKFPKHNIIASGDHEVFTADKGVQRALVEDLVEGEKLIFPERTKSSDKEHLMQVERYYNSLKNSEKGRKQLEELRKDSDFPQKEPGEESEPELLPTKIKSIEKLDERKVIDISVEAGNFIANNLVVHNSAQRFARIRKQMLKTFLNEIADNAKSAFLEKSREDKLLGILVGGPGFTKDKFLDEYLHQELEEKVVAVESLNYSGEEALEELVNKAEDAIEDAVVVKEKNLVNEFFDNLRKENGKSEYGLEQVMKAMEMGAVDTVMISEDYNHYMAEYECDNGHEKKVYEEKAEIDDDITCDECGESMKLEELSDIVDVMADKAQQMGSDVELISTDHEEGKRLDKMGGIAAILRYRIR